MIEKCKFMGKVLGLVSLIILFLPGRSGAVGIYLIPDALNVSPGQQFNIDVVLDNPASEGLWALGIWLKYDKDLLNVIDTDTGNWITEGTNILDGPFHDPFDLPGSFGFPNLNDAGTDGEIMWDAGRDFLDPNIYPSGTFARITFEAENNLGSTDLNFDGTGLGSYPDTYVMNDSFEQILTSTTGATVTVNAIPEPANLVLMTTGLMMLFGNLIRKKV